MTPEPMHILYHKTKDVCHELVSMKEGTTILCQDLNRKSKRRRRVASRGQEIEKTNDSNRLRSRWWHTMTSAPTRICLLPLLTCQCPVWQTLTDTPEDLLLEQKFAPTLANVVTAILQALSLRLIEHRRKSQSVPGRCVPRRQLEKVQTTENPEIMDTVGAGPRHPAVQKIIHPFQFQIVQRNSYQNLTQTCLRHTVVEDSVLHHGVMPTSDTDRERLVQGENRLEAEVHCQVLGMYNCGLY